MNDTFAFFAFRQILVGLGYQLPFEMDWFNTFDALAIFQIELTVLWYFFEYSSCQNQILL